MFYDIFDILCKEKGVSANKACIDMGLSRSIAAKWKSTKTNPSADILPKIAEYFGVSIDFLLEKAQKENPITVSDDGAADQDRALIKLFRQLTPAEKEFLVSQMEVMIAKRKPL